MSNTKVYLAKSSLASGLDVEYVKSNLMRIPNIDIVEFGLGIEPNECACVVIVPSSKENVEFLDAITLSKNVALDAENFLDQDFEDVPENFLIIYGGKLDTDHTDVENDTPLALLGGLYYTHKEDEFDDYAKLEIEDGSENLLLDVVMDAIGEYHRQFQPWKSVPRYFQPSAKYAMPPIPSVMDRRLRKPVRHSVPDQSGSMQGSTFTPVGRIKSYDGPVPFERDYPAAQTGVAIASSTYNKRLERRSRRQ